MDDYMLTDDQVQMILEDYHRKQLVENMIGPGVSLTIHLIVLSLMFVFMVTKPRQKLEKITVEVVEMETKEIEPEVKEEIEEIQEDVTEDVPTSDPVENPSETVGTTDSIVDVSDDAPMTDDNSDANEIMDFVNTNSVLRFSGPLGGRTNAGRAGNVRKYGGGKRGQAAVEKSLKWLAKVQNANGSWGDGEGSAAHSGLALLVFLAHGETPLSEKYGPTVQNAMKWLADYAADPGSLTKGGQKAYGYGIAAYAISESYAMTKIPSMQTAMETAIANVIEGQQIGGGFDYNYAKETRFDVSISGWSIQALKAARVAGSTNENLKKAIENAINFCRKNAYDGPQKQFVYSNVVGAKGDHTLKNVFKPNMTGVGVVALQLLGAGSSAEAKGGLQFIETERIKGYEEVVENSAKWKENAGEFLYGWYYDTQAVFNAQADGTGKERWKRWREAFEKVLVRAQHSEGYWETNGKHGIGSENTPGRVLATCFCSLQLEVYYRYLPTFDIKKMDEAAAADEVDAGIEDVGTGAGIKLN